MNISLNIRKLREAKRLTQNDIAERLGVDGSNYAKQEKRGNKLSIEQLEKIAVALGVSVQELVFGESVVDIEQLVVLKAKLTEQEEKIKALEMDIERQNKVIDMITPFAQQVMKGFEFVHDATKSTDSTVIKTDKTVDNNAQKAKEIVDSIFDKKQ